MDFYNLNLLAKVAVDILEKERTNKNHNHTHTHLHSSSTLHKIPKLVFNFPHTEKSFVLGNPQTTTMTTENDSWPLLFCRKQRTTLSRKPRLSLLQTTTMLSTEKEEDQEIDPSSVLPIKKRKWNMSSSSEDEDHYCEKDKKKKKKKKRKITRPTWVNSEPKALPIELKNKIQELGGQDLWLIIEKQLTVTDVNKNNNRLSIPVSDVRWPEFLREDEKEKLKEADEKHKKRLKGIQVLVIDESLREYDRCQLKQWNMGNTPVYNLVTKWFDIVKDNKLAEFDVVQLWSFRVRSNLCFAILKVSSNRGSCMKRKMAVMDI